MPTKILADIMYLWYTEHCLCVKPLAPHIYRNETLTCKVTFMMIQEANDKKGNQYFVPFFS